MKKSCLLFLGAILAFLACMAIDKITNNKIYNFTTLSILYIFNSEEVKFNEVKLKIPYYYIKKNLRNRLSLSEYPSRSASITLTKDKHLSIGLIEGYKIAYKKQGYKYVNEGKVIIDNEEAYLLKMIKEKDKEKHLYMILLPNINIMISYQGSTKGLEDFEKIVSQIKIFDDKGDICKWA